MKKYNYDLKAFTNDKFQKFIDEYNSKQSRPERRKTRSYVEMIEEENKKLINKAEDNKKKGIKSSVRKPTQLAHEYVLQIGNKDTNSTLTADVEKNKQYCREVLEEIEKNIRMWKYYLPLITLMSRRERHICTYWYNLLVKAISRA